jgi:hypothetical protein
MRNWMVAVLIILWVTPLFSADLSCLRNKALEERIGEFDEKDFYDPKLDEALLKNPRNSSCLLINNLKTIPLDTSNPGFWNTIGTLSVLERLTCTSMRGKTTEKFLGREEEQRKHFLGAQESDEVAFVGYHMTNSEFFVAPVDAQLAIINKWHAWYKQKSEGYSYGECK